MIIGIGRKVMPLAGVGVSDLDNIRWLLSEAKLGSIGDTAFYDERVCFRSPVKLRYCQMTIRLRRPKLPPTDDKKCCILAIRLGCSRGPPKAAEGCCGVWKAETLVAGRDRGHNLV